MARQLLWTAPLLCVLLNAQGVGVGNITGLTVDSSGAAMAQVRLEAKNTSTGVVVATTSNDAGNYAIPNLIPGTYVLSAVAGGFKKYLRSGLVAQVGQTMRADVRMELGDVTEIVDVHASAPLVQTETGSLGSVIDNQKVTQMPLNGRNTIWCNWCPARRPMAPAGRASTVRARAATNTW